MIRQSSYWGRWALGLAEYGNAFVYPGRGGVSITSLATWYTPCTVPPAELLGMPDPKPASKV